MTELIFKVFQTLTSGFRIYKESKKNLFKNFLEPAMSDFETVHENYLSSFKTYTKIIEESTKPLNKKHPVFGMIKNDALFSINIRDKVYSFYDYTNDEKFKNFIVSMMDYFRYSVDSPNFNNTLDYEMEMCRNAIRNGTYNGLVFIIENNNLKNKKSLALTQTKMAIMKLQDNYRKVIDNYNSLKIELLKE